MRSKQYLFLGIVFTVFAFSAIPAVANILTSASAKADCSGYTPNRQRSGSGK